MAAMNHDVDLINRTRTGDAEISAYLEDSNSKTLVSENRDFLFEIEGLPFRVLISTEAINEFLF